MPKRWHWSTTGECPHCGKSFGLIIHGDEDVEVVLPEKILDLECEKCGIDIFSTEFGGECKKCKRSLCRECGGPTEAIELCTDCAREDIDGKLMTRYGSNILSFTLLKEKMPNWGARNVEQEVVPFLISFALKKKIPSSQIALLEPIVQTSLKLANKERSATLRLSHVSQAIEQQVPELIEEIRLESEEIKEILGVKPNRRAVRRNKTKLQSK